MKEEASMTAPVAICQRTVLIDSIFGSACSVIIIVIGNGHDDTSSNPGRD